MPRTPVVGATVTQALTAVAELVLPLECAGCAAPGCRWCPGCAAVLFRPRPRRWSPTPSPPGLPPTWTAVPYEGPVRRAVVAWKDQGRRDLTGMLAPTLGRALGLAVRQDHGLGAVLRGGGRVLLVPAPSARRTVRSRGDRPMVSLARAVAAELPVGPVAPVLRVRRSVADQAGLDHRSRAANLAGALVVRSRSATAVQGACCVLLDDVVTTGATLAEAARALREAGAAHVLAVTVAAARRRAAAGAVPGSPGSRGGE